MSCPICLGTGLVMNTGEPCECRGIEDLQHQNLISLDWFPRTYLDVKFNKLLCSNNKLSTYLLTLREEILNKGYITDTLWIQSESKTGKTIFVYDVIQALYSQGTDVFPLIDLMELDSIIQSIHKGEKSIYLDECIDQNRIYTTPVLFLKNGKEKKYEAYNALVTLIDRRVRRGFGTIIISSVDIDDTFPNNVTLQKGNGSYGTVRVIDEFSR